MKLWRVLFVAVTADNHTGNDETENKLSEKNSPHCVNITAMYNTNANTDLKFYSQSWYLAYR